MSLKITFLGTAGSVPTTQRSLPSIAIHRKDELILFDCGEGVQRQMIRAKIGFHKKTKVFITHMHGDHILGLPGLIQTMSLLDRQKKLQVYGPVGLEKFLEAIKTTVQFALTFPLEILEIKNPGTVCDEEEYLVEATWANHEIPTLAYALTEKPRPGKFYPEKAKALGVPEGPLWSKLQKGKNVKLPSGRKIKPEEVMGPPRAGRKIVYITDTRQTAHLVELAKNADVLIHEATFDDTLAERAYKDGHCTPTLAAQTAKKAKAKWLILTHISARYKDASVLLQQAKKIFPKVDVAEDFMKIELPLPES